MTPWLRNRLAAIRDHERRIDRLFGPDRGNGIGDSTWHPSTPEPGWSCARDGHLYTRIFGDPAHCVVCGIDEDDEQ